MKIIPNGMKIIPKDSFQIIYDVKNGGVGESRGLSIIFLGPKVLEVLS